MTEPTSDSTAGLSYVRAGERFGRLEAPASVPRWHGMVLCRCDCGDEKEYQARNLRRGMTQSCGCLRRDRIIAGWERKHHQRPAPYIIAGQIFGRLTALEESWSSTRMVLCECECGTEKRIRANSLRHRSTSCGCLTKERAAAACTAKAPHGSMSTSPLHKPLYGIWGAIVARTTNPNHGSYADYGARGIQIYGPWLVDPEAFIYWILEHLGPRPEGRYPSGYPMYTLDRINNDGNYEPGNLRWATRKQQQDNRRPMATQAKLRKLEEENRLLRQQLEGARPARRPRATVTAKQVALFD